MKDISIVKSNISKMIDQNAPESDIDRYIELEGYTLDDIRNYKNSTKKEDIDRVEAALRTGYQGATFGFGDEITAAGRVLGAKALGSDDSFKDLYKLAKGEEREKLKQAEEKYPVQSFATELTGGLITGVPGIAKINPFSGSGAITKKLSSVGNLASKGAVAGGIAGLGETDNITDLSQTGKDVTEGAVTGAIATPIFVGGVKLAGKGANAIARLKNIFKNNTDRDVAAEIIAKNIPKSEIKKGLQQINDAEIPLGTKMNLPTVGIDIETPEFESLLKTTVNKFPDAKRIAADFAKGRTKEAYDRINYNLDKISRRNGYDDIDKLKQEMGVITKPLYEIADEKNIPIPQFQYKTIKTTEGPVTTKISRVDKSFDSQSDINDKTESLENYLKTSSKNVEANPLNKKLTIEGENYLNSSKGTSKSSEGTKNLNNVTRTQTRTIQEGDKNIIEKRKIINFDDLSPKDKLIANQLEDVKNDELFRVGSNAMKSLGYKSEINSTDDLINLKIALDKQFAGTSNPNLQRRISLYNKKINGLIGELVPERKTADEIYSKYMKVIDAGEEGKNFKNMNDYDIKKLMNSYDANQKEYFKATVKEDLLRDVSKYIKKNDSRGAEAIFGDLSKQNKVKQLFGNDAKGFDKFKKTMLEEIEYNETLDKLGLKGIDVAKEENAIPNLVGRGIAFVAAGGKTGAAFEIGRTIDKALLKKYKGLNKSTSQSLAKAFTNRFSTISSLEKALKTAEGAEQKKLIEKIINDIAPVIIATQVDKLIGTANASNSNITQDQIKKSILQRGEKLPSSKIPEKEAEKEARFIKQRYYRGQ